MIYISRDKRGAAPFRLAVESFRGELRPLGELCSNVDILSTSFRRNLEVRKSPGKKSLVQDYQNNQSGNFLIFPAD